MSDQGETQSQPSIRDRIGAVLSPPQEQAPEPVEQEAPEVEAQEPTQDEPVEPVETPEQEAPEAAPEDWVEIEVNGKALQVPKEFEKAFMQERDYTQKRQADADRARIVEAREHGLQVREQALQAMQPLLAQAQNIEGILQNAQRIDWEALRRDDPVEYSAKRADYAALLQQRADLHQQINQGHNWISQQAQQSLAQQIAAAAPLIKKAVPDWSPEKDQKLTKMALEKGATPFELQNFVATRPWAIELMDAANRWYELQASKAQLPKKAFTPSPVAKPGAKPTHVQAETALYRKNIETFRKSGGKDAKALRAVIKAKLGT
jgi:hypothetical protein